MSKANLAFPTENDLVATFVSHLSTGTTLWARCIFLREFDYISGRTDVLSMAPDNEVVAFEAKLSNWRKALHQAWRNTSFANRVYVVLPKNRVTAALKHKNQFEELGVGLYSVDEQGINLLIDSAKMNPVIPWLHNKAREMLIKHDGFKCSTTSTTGLQ